MVSPFDEERVSRPRSSSRSDCLSQRHPFVPFQITHLDSKRMVIKDYRLRRNEVITFVVGTESFWKLGRLREIEPSDAQPQRAEPFPERLGTADVELRPALRRASERRNRGAVRERARLIGEHERANPGHSDSNA